MKIVHDLQFQFPQINIKLGIELDYIEDADDYLEKFVDENNFDYIIGSVHYLNVDSAHRCVYLNDLHRDKKPELFRIYFDSLEKAIHTGLFDIIGHFDLPRRFWGDLNAECLTYAKRTMELIKKYDLCLEINTSGFRTKNVEEPFPGTKLLYLAKEMGIPITLGSDSHSPRDVGSYFDEAIALLKVIGFKNINIFSNRKREAIPI